MNDFISVCPNCKSSNIKQHNPHLVNSWFCLNCGNRDFMPIEILRKDL